jgi:hypothetical protein
MTSSSGWLPLTSCQQETVGADGGDAGDMPQRRGEIQSLRLHLPSEAAQGDPVLLAKANHKDLKTLVTQADELWPSTTTTAAAAACCTCG